MTVLAADSLGAGAIGFLVVLALAVAAFFLFRSMSKHIRKVPPTFEQQDVSSQANDDHPG
jgi:hypothetical protein